MTIESWAAELIVQLPNLAVALLVLYWQRKTIDELLLHQRTLVDKLLQMVDDVREVDQVRLVQPQEPNVPK